MAASLACFGTLGSLSSSFNLSEKKWNFFNKWKYLNQYPDVRRPVRWGLISVGESQDRTGRMGQAPQFLVTAQFSIA